MAFEVAQGTLVTPSSAATNSTISGLSFQPKAIILFGSEGDGSGAGSAWNIGFATGTAEEVCWSGGAVDNVGTTSCYEKHVTETDTNGRIISLRRGGTWHYEGQLDSINSDGFTIDWTVISNPGKTVDLHWICLGGSDLTNAKAGGFEAPSSTGDKSVDVGFEPDFVLILHSTGVGIIASSDISQSIGAATSSTSRWLCSSLDDHAVATSDTSRSQREDNVAEGYFPGGTLKYRADFKEFYSTGSGGFTINYSATGSGQEAAYLALKGGQYAVGSGLQETAGSAPTDKAYTGVGFQPKLTLFTSFNNTATTSEQTNLRRSFGAAESSTSRRSIWSGSEDNQATSDTSYASDKTKCLKMMTEASSSPTTQASADFKSNDSDGFTLTWDPYDTTARQFCYICFADADVGTTATATILEGEYLVGTPTARNDPRCEIVEAEYLEQAPTAALVEEIATAALVEAEYIHEVPTATEETIDAAAALAEAEYVLGAPSAANVQTTATVALLTADYAVPGTTAAIGVVAAAEIVLAEYAEGTPTAVEEEVLSASEVTEAEYLLEVPTAANTAETASAGIVEGEYALLAPTAETEELGVQATAVLAEAEYLLGTPSAQNVQKIGTAASLTADYAVGDPTATVVAEIAAAEIAEAEYLLGTPFAFSGTAGLLELVEAEYPVPDMAAALVEETEAAALVEAEYSVPAPTATVPLESEDAALVEAEYLLEAPAAAVVPITATAALALAEYLIGAPSAATEAAGVEETVEIVRGEYLVPGPVAFSGVAGFLDAVEAAYTANDPTAALIPITATAEIFQGGEYLLETPTAERIPLPDCNAQLFLAEYLLDTPTAENQAVAGSFQVVLSDYTVGSPTALVGIQASPAAIAPEYILPEPTASFAVEAATALAFSAEYLVPSSNAIPGLVCTAVGIACEYIVLSHQAIPPFEELVERVWAVPSGREGSWRIPSD
jgi:hypothetical protein